MQDVGASGRRYDEDRETSFTCCENILMFFAWILVIICFPLWFSIINQVKDYERAVIFRLGKLSGGAKGPGVFAINPLTDVIRVVDLRVETKNLPPQEMMTKDSVTITVDAICFMKVANPVSCVLEVDDYKKAFELFCATSLRAVIGTYELQSILSEREELNERVRNIIEHETAAWGVAVPSVEIKDVQLPVGMQRAMAAEAEAERERRAKIINARGEAEAAEELANAARIIADSPGALQLRYLHTLSKIAAEHNSTILFPLPIELMRGINLGGR